MLILSCSAQAVLALDLTADEPDSTSEQALPSDFLRMFGLAKHLSTQKPGRWNHSETTLRGTLHVHYGFPIPYRSIWQCTPHTDSRRLEWLPYERMRCIFSGWNDLLRHTSVPTALAHRTPSEKAFALSACIPRRPLLMPNFHWCRNPRAEPSWGFLRINRLSQSIF